MKQKPKELDWEKEFENEFGKEAQSTSSLDLYDFYEFGIYGEIKDFIQSLLTQQRTELLEEIKKQSNHCFVVSEKNNNVKLYSLERFFKEKIIKL